MPNVKDRILQLADIKNIGRKRFTEQLGMTYSSFTGKAKSTPLNSHAITNLLALFPDINANWLLTGEGEILIPLIREGGNEWRPAGVGKFAGKGVDSFPIFEGATESAGSVYKSLMDERQTHNEIVLSQQRTIEKLVNLINKAQ